MNILLLFSFFTSRVVFSSIHVHILIHTHSHSLSLSLSLSHIEPFLIFLVICPYSMKILLLFTFFTSRVVISSIPVHILIHTHSHSLSLSLSLSLSYRILSNLFCNLPFLHEHFTVIYFLHFTSGYLIDPCTYTNTYSLPLSLSLI